MCPSTWLWRIWAPPSSSALQACPQLPWLYFLSPWPAAIQALGASLIFSCFGRGKWNKDFRIEAASFHLSRMRFLLSDFMTVIKELGICRTSGSIAFKYTQTLFRVQWWMQLKPGDFPSVPSLLWCGDWEMTDCPDLFCDHSNFIDLGTSLLPCPLFAGIVGVIFPDPLVLPFSFYENTFPLFWSLCQCFYVTVFFVACTLSS